MMGSVSIQAMGKGKESLLISVSRQGLFYIPLLFNLNSCFKLDGLVYAQPIADCLALIFTLFLSIRIIQKEKKEQDKF